MLNKENEPILKQEIEKFNKPHILVKIALDKALTTRDKKIYNIFIRELLMLNLKQFKTNVINLSITKISQLLGVTTRTELYKSLDKLRNTDISFDNEAIITFPKMISSYTRAKNNQKDSLRILFDTDLTDTILKYGNRYAKLDIADINSLKITHSITLYELFIRSLGTYTNQKLHYTEQELRKYLHLQDKYLDIKLFNQKVVKNSITELNKKTKLSVTYKRVKENNVNIYKFHIKQELIYNFNKFKKTITHNKCYQDIVFKYKATSYTFYKDLEDKKPQYLIINARTYETLDKEKAEKIWTYMYKLLNKNDKEFVYKFITFRDLSLKGFTSTILEQSDSDELDYFREKYHLTM